MLGASGRTEFDQIRIGDREKSNKNIFDSKKDCILATYSHRFLNVDDAGWILLREKLMHMKEIYGGKKSFQLCGECMTISRTECSSAHLRVVVASIFFQIDPEAIKPTELADFFLKHGRQIKYKKGNSLICFPSFNFECSEEYPFLSGSVLGNILSIIKVLIYVPWLLTS